MKEEMANNTPAEPPLSEDKEKHVREMDLVLECDLQHNA